MSGLESTDSKIARHCVPECAVLVSVVAERYWWALLLSAIGEHLCTNITKREYYLLHSAHICPLHVTFALVRYHIKMYVEEDTKTKAGSKRKVHKLSVSAFGTCINWGMLLNLWGSVLYVHKSKNESKVHKLAIPWKVKYGRHILCLIPSLVAGTTSQSIHFRVADFLSTVQCPVVRIGALHPLTSKRALLPPPPLGHRGKHTRMRGREQGTQFGRLARNSGALWTLHIRSTSLAYLFKARNFDCQILSQSFLFHKLTYVHSDRIDQWKPWNFPLSKAIT